MQMRRIFFPIRRSCRIAFRASFSTAGVDGNGDDDACASLHAEQVLSAVLSLAEEAPSGSLQDRLAATKALRAALAKAAVAAGSQRRVLQSDEDPNSPEQIDVYFDSRKLRLSDLHAHLLSLVAVGADVEAYVDDVLAADAPIPAQSLTFGTTPFETVAACLDLLRDRYDFEANPFDNFGAGGSKGGPGG